MKRQYFDENVLSLLKNEQLSSVIFVQDYLQLDFDGNRLTCYVWPMVYINKQRYKFTDHDYKNKICDLISKLIKDVILNNENSLELLFEDESKIILSLS